MLLKNTPDERILKKTIKAIDMGLLMGNEFRNELTKAASLLCKILQQYSIGITIKEICLSNKINIFLCIESPVLLCNNAKANSKNCTLHRTGDRVATLHQPSLETFLRDFLKPQLPVKITGKV